MSHEELVLTLDIVRQHVSPHLLADIGEARVAVAIEIVNAKHDMQYGPPRDQRDLYWRARAVDTELRRIIPPAC